MITEKESTRISKFLSFIMRHKPEAAGIQLDENGWTDVDILIAQMNQSGIAVTLEVLRHVVETNAKKRFAFNEDQTKIRASQGHSVDVALGYEPKEPPPVLYHGTAQTSLDSILKGGLEKRSRHHVHLSTDLDTAIKVGQRYGKPVVLKVAAQEMFREGFLFYLSENDVWLTDHVPARYLSGN